MTRMYAVKKAGSVCKRTRYVSNTPNPSAAKAPGKRSKEKRKRDKLRESVEKLGMLIAGNFDMKNDKSVVLTIPGAKKEKLKRKAKKDKTTYYLAALEDRNKFLKSFQRRMHAENRPFRCIAITSQHTRQGKRTNLHHHLLVNADALPYVTDAWTKWVRKTGKVSGVIVRSKTLYEDAGKGAGAYALAGYLLAQVTHYKNKSAYFASKNLERPVVVEKGTVTCGFRLRAPSDAEILRMTGTDRNPTASITYRMNQKGGKHNKS